MRAHDAEHQKVLSANPNAVRNLADIHQGPALRASFEASMKNLDAPNAHSDWLHQNVVSKMEPAAVSAGLSKLHAAAGHEPATPAPTGFIPKLKNWLGTSGEAHSYTLPADEASQRKQLSVAMSHAAQHGFHADASQAVGVPVPSHQQLASATAQALTQPVQPSKEDQNRARFHGMPPEAPITVNHVNPATGQMETQRPAVYHGIDESTGKVKYQIGTGETFMVPPEHVSFGTFPGIEGSKRASSLPNPLSLHRI
jgi:hypothetical protein